MPTLAGDMEKVATTPMLSSCSPPATKGARETPQGPKPHRARQHRLPAYGAALLPAGQDARSSQLRTGRTCSSWAPHTSGLPPSAAPFCCPLLLPPSGCRSPCRRCCCGEGVDGEGVDDGVVRDGDALRKGKEDVSMNLDPDAGVISGSDSAARVERRPREGEAPGWR
jgi:hypothetical protein